MTDFDQHSYEGDRRLHAAHAREQAPHRRAAGRGARIRPQGAAGQTTGSSPRWRTTPTRRVPGRWSRCSNSAPPVRPPTRRFYEPIQPEYRDRDKHHPARRAADREGHRHARWWALLAEATSDGIEPLYDNIESLQTSGSTKTGALPTDTIYAPAMISMRDLDRACEELDRGTDKGARFIVMPAGPAYGRSPATRTSTRSGLDQRPAP